MFFLFYFFIYFLFFEGQLGGGGVRVIAFLFILLGLNSCLYISESNSPVLSVNSAAFNHVSGRTRKACVVIVIRKEVCSLLGFEVITCGVKIDLKH